MTDRSTKYRDGSPTYEVTSASGNVHYISFGSTAAKERGTDWSCDCMDWIIRKNDRCKHLKGDSRVQPRAPGRTPPLTEVALGALTRLMASATERSDAKKATREKASAEKNDRLSRYRFGFQLAKTLESGEAIDFANSVFEVKYDGELGMMIDGRLINRSGNDVTDRFPEIEKTDKAVLVGEVVIDPESGTGNFNKIQQRATDDPMKIRIRSLEIPAKFIAFDILELKSNGEPLADLPLAIRYRQLKAFLEANPLRNVELVEQLAPSSRGEVDAMMATMAEAGGEGFMVKDLRRPYVAKRGRNWLKLKTWQDDVFEVVKHGPTGVGDGYTIFVQSGAHLQEVSMGDREMRTRVRVGSRVEVKFLSRGADGALRFPTVRRLLG